MPDGYILNEKDKRILKDVVREVLQDVINPGLAPDVLDKPERAPDMYLVALPAGESIAGFDGTNYHHNYCDIYKISAESDDTAAIPTKIQNAHLRVWNTDTADTPIGTNPPTFFLAQRDKFGRWVRVAAPGPKDTVPGKNVSGETMPKGGIVAIVDEEVNDDVVTYHGDKPSTTFKKLYMVAAGDIADTATGEFYPPGKLATILCDTAPGLHDTYGPTASSWTATRGNPEIGRVAGVIDTTYAKAIIKVPEILLIKNTTGSSIAANSSGNFTIQNASLGDAGFDDLSMSNRGSVAFADGKFGSGVLINGNWYASPWECP